MILTVLDHVDSPRPRYAEHPAAGQERPGGPAGAYEERASADKDPEADGGWCDSPGTVNAVTTKRKSDDACNSFKWLFLIICMCSFNSCCARHTTIVGFVFCTSTCTEYSVVGRCHTGSLSIEV